MSRLLSLPNFRGRQKAVLRLYRKFHRELVDDLLGISINDEAYSIFGADAALVAIENLVLIHFRGGSLMLHSRRIVIHLNVRERVSAALVAQQQTVALREVAGIDRIGHDSHLTAVAVLAMSCRYSLETIRLLVFRPKCIILVPVSAC